MVLASGATFSVTGVELLDAKELSPAYLAITVYWPPGKLLIFADEAPLWSVSSLRPVLTLGVAVVARATSPEGVPPLP